MPGVHPSNTGFMKCRRRLCWPRIGSAQSKVQHGRPGEKPLLESLSGLSYSEAIQRIIAVLSNPATGSLKSLDELDAVGFKVVHAFKVSGCVELTEDVLKAMKEYVPVSPLHNKVYLDVIQLFREEMPNTPLVGLFETDFHQTVPEYAWRYAVPRQWEEEYGVRRYGFHGASFRYLAGRARDLVRATDEEQRVVACHLGGSSSVCALKGGKSLGTTMGFSPQSGLPQSTRVGGRDAFCLLYLLRKGHSVEELEQELIKNSGLKGISDLSGDVPTLEKAVAEGDGKALMALEVFVHEVQKYIGAYTAVLKGIDALIFSGGIGERGAKVRSMICEPFEYLGLRLDPEKNLKVEGESRISAEDSRVEIWVLPTNEEVVVAREACQLLSKA